MRAVPLIEPLEDRIAPAALTISANGKIATYTDGNHDIVNLSTSKGAFVATQFTFDSSGNLSELNIAGNSAFTGSNLLFSVTPVVTAGAPGSTQTNVAYIDAIGVSLGSVTLPGDLGRIDVGGGSSSVALGKLSVTTLGAVAGTTGISDITGKVNTVTVAGNLEGTLRVLDFGSHVATGSIGTLDIGGSLNARGNSGGPADVFFTGTLGTAVINGGIEGGSAANSGSIGGYQTSISGTTDLVVVNGLGSLSKIGSITVKGSVPNDPNPSALPGVPGTSIYGGSGSQSGSIVAATISNALVAGDVTGNIGTASGAIQAGLKLAKIVVNGSVVGGNFVPGNPGEAVSSGLIFGGSIGNLLIGKSVFGGSGIDSGIILSTGLIQKAVVVGDVVGGSAGNGSGPGAAGAITGHSIASIIVDGSLIGGTAVSTDPNQTAKGGGSITSDTSIGTLFIGKNVVGGSGPSTGTILTNAGGITSLTIGGIDNTDGSLLGGSGSSSGVISIAGTAGKISLTHGVAGGPGANSGDISVNGGLNSFVLGGGIAGGSADFTGNLTVFGTLKSASIQGGITGSNSGATKLTNTGYVQANAIGNFTMVGALTSGTAGAGGLDTSGAIRSETTIGSITVGSLIGNATNPAVISAVGSASLGSNATSDVAIQTITVKGPPAMANQPIVSFADILAGYSPDTSTANPFGTPVSADAQIGTVKIGGNMTASNIIAGVTAGTGGFGNSTAVPSSGIGVVDLPGIVSKISQIVITGSVTVDSTATGTFGIAAQQIVKANYNGLNITLRPGADNDTFANTATHTLGTGDGEIVLFEV